MTPVQTEWWFRPVSKAARVGEHSAVVWKRLNRSPSAASRSIVGEGTSPPNVLNCPKPASSIRISTTFGAPLGAATGCGNFAGSESFQVRPTVPGKWKSGRGRTDGVCGSFDEVVGSAPKAIVVAKISTDAVNAIVFMACLMMFDLQVLVRPR